MAETPHRAGGDRLLFYDIILRAAVRRGYLTLRRILWDGAALSPGGGVGSFDSLSLISPTVSFAEGTSFVTVTPVWEDALS